MSEKEIEKIIRNVKATMHIEGLEMTEEEIENCRKVLRGKETADEIVEFYKRELVKSYVR